MTRSVYTRPIHPFLAILICAVFALQTAGALAASALVFDRATNSWKRTDVRPGTPLISNRRKSSVPREVVDYPAKYKKGTIVINTAERRLYRVLGNGTAMRYGIGVGREGFTWKGRERISRKAEWPSWVPPEEMRRREAAEGRILPARMEGGITNPLGARALYLGSTLYRLHGTNQPWTIGRAVSSGCIRLTNEDIVHLYNQAKIGDMVVVK